MFEHLDDPAPLPPSTREQRQATVHRGNLLRRRRRTGVFTAVAAAAAVVGALALPPALRGDGAVPPVAASPAPSPSVTATATAGPGRGSMTVGSTGQELRVTFTMPAGWQTEDGWLFRSDNYRRANPGTGMPYGFVFLNVVNLYADGCQWRLLDPPPGPTVDDLVTAYADVPGFGGTVRDITVDGFPGKLLTHTIPDYDADDCKNDRYGIFKEDEFPDTTPNILAQAPNQQNQVRILDVNGTRLVILTGHPPNITTQEQAELDDIASSLQIG